jgi:hypothetical protein
LERPCPQGRFLLRARVNGRLRAVRVSCGILARFVPAQGFKVAVYPLPLARCHPARPPLYPVKRVRPL